MLEARLWNALNIVALLIPAIVTLYASLYVPSPFTQRQLQSFTPITSDVTRAFAAFRALGNDIQISVTKDNSPIKNLAVSVVGVINNGSVAIIPSDFYENLSINVDTPWKILAVKGTNSARENIVWTRVNDQRFEIHPQLLNPGDYIAATVYATNTQEEQSPMAELLPYWTTHILNLKSIEPGNIGRSFTIGGFGIVVYLEGISLVMTVAGAIFFLFIYINLLYRLKWIQNPGWLSVLAIIGAGLISLASAEAMATYVLPTSMYRAMGISNVYNLPPIVINLCVLGYLSWRAWRVQVVPPSAHP